MVLTANSANPNASRPVRAGSLAAWAVAIRPASLPVAICPVLVGAAMGFARTGNIDLVAALLVLAAAVLIQVITNLQNDVGYTARGGEAGGTRIGLPRATANGWLGMRQVRVGIVLAVALAVALGLTLVAYRGWPVLMIGIVSLLAALTYMGGPLPIAYTPLGELTVFLFFGLVAVIGTDWVLTASVGPLSMLAAAAIGGLAAAALAVNNHRDMAHDRATGRKTLAVRYGAKASEKLYAALLLVPFCLVPVMALAGAAPELLLPLLLLPTAWVLRRDFVECALGTGFNQLLFRTFRLQLWFAGLLSAGALAGRLQA